MRFFHTKNKDIGHSLCPFIMPFQWCDLDNDTIVGGGQYNRKQKRKRLQRFPSLEQPILVGLICFSNGRNVKSPSLPTSSPLLLLASKHLPKER
jgi:hypothetical protein